MGPRELSRGRGRTPGGDPAPSHAPDEPRPGHAPGHARPRWRRRRPPRDRHWHQEWHRGQHRDWAEVSGAEQGSRAGRGSRCLGASSLRDRPVCCCFVSAASRQLPPPPRASCPARPAPAPRGCLGAAPAHPGPFCGSPGPGPCPAPCPAPPGQAPGRMAGAALFLLLLLSITGGSGCVSRRGDPAGGRTLPARRPRQRGTL